MQVYFDAESQCRSDAVSATDHGSDQRWMTSVSPSSMTMPTASSWIEHYFPNYGSSGPHTPFSPPSHGELTTHLSETELKSVS